MKNSNFLNNLKNDLPSSVVVFFVAVPLCLGIALASGAPPFSGLVAGVIGGIIVGFISGSSLGVSGPAAGLAAIVLAAISSLGSFENFLVAVVIAGVFQVILGLLRAGIIGYYFPTSVIKGMLSGIGIIIVLKQIPHFFGYDKDPEGDWDFIQVDGENTFSEILNAINHITPGSLLIATIGLLIILLWDNILAKKHTFFKLIQGPFVAVVLGVLFVVFFGDHATLGIAKTHLVNIPAPEEFSGWVNVFSTPNFSAITDINVWVVAGTMAIVASLETLLSVEATDKLDPQKRTTPTNRELFAQGTGNIVSGMIGGLPITQVIVRSSANIQSGGKTKTSAILHGFLIITTVLFIPGILNLIPLSVLAAVLFVVGYKLAKPAVFKKMFNLGWSQFTPYIATIIVIVWKDLLWGIGVGLVLAFFNVLFKSFKNNYFLHKETPKGETGTIKMTLPEEVSFLNKATIKKELDDVPVDSHLEIDVRNNVFVDYDIAEIFADYSPKAKERNIHINIIAQDEVISNPDDFYDFFLSKTYSAKNKIKKMKTQTKETQSQLTPTKVQQILVEGNNRFMKAEMAKRNLLEQMKATTDGQYPHSVILSCIDSRTSSELIFDQGIGDIFNTRVAGNVINDDVLGSIEYSCKVAGSKLVVVLGHSKCGAVTSACQHIELGNITALLKKIQPAVDTISSKVEDITAPESVQMVADENVKHAIKEIREKSEILAQMEKDGEIKIVGGMYNIESGKVTFFD